MVRNLQATKVSPHYRNELVKGWEAVSLYILSLGLAVQWRTVSFEKTNEILVGFVQDCYEKKGVKGFRVAKHGVLAVQGFFPRFRGHLRLAWESVKSWEVEVPASLRCAISLPVLLAMSIVSKVFGFASSGIDAYLWFACGVILEAGFFGLLRPVEMLGLRPCLLYLPNRMLSLAGDCAVVALIQPKNAKYAGRIQFSIIRSKHTTSWLDWISECVPREAKLWPGTAKELRKRVKRLASFIGLSGWNILPSSARPGGTTHFFEQGVEPDRLMFWGRWLSANSLRHYVQESIAAQLVLNTPEHAHTFISNILHACDDFLDPPAGPWWEYGLRADVRNPSRIVTHNTNHASTQWKQRFQFNGHTC